MRRLRRLHHGVPDRRHQLRYPRAGERGARIKALLSTYAAAGEQGATLMVHSQDKGQALIGELGRAAQLKLMNGVPHQVMPLAVWHTASLGIDVWLSAIAWGAEQVLVLTTDEEAPQYLDGLQAQMDVAQALLNGLGYSGAFQAVARALDAGSGSCAAESAADHAARAQNSGALCHRARKAQHAGAGAGSPDRPVAAGRRGPR